jgi:hypothetical protein
VEAIARGSPGNGNERRPTEHDRFDAASSWDRSSLWRAAGRCAGLLRLSSSRSWPRVFPGGHLYSQLKEFQDAAHGELVRKPLRFSRELLEWRSREQVLAR